VHRIGRTGRAGKTGIAHTFFTHLDKAHSGELFNILTEAGAPVPEELVKRFGTTVKRKEHALYGSHHGGAKAGDKPLPPPTKMVFD
jgi:ATP-dependent RNA helicase DBP3